MSSEHPSREITLTLLTTNDLHSQVTGAGGLDRYPSTQRGHYARIVRYLRSERSALEAEGHLVLTLDAGDWYSGTAFDRIGISANHKSVPELQMFDAAAFDAITIGNHEFDAGEQGFLTMLKKRQALGISTPIVVSNLRTDTDDEGERVPEIAREVFQDFVVKEFALAGSSAGGDCLRVGMLGVFGEDCAMVSRNVRDKLRFYGFDDTKNRAQHAELIQCLQPKIDHLRSAERCDVVIMIVHAGEPEDEKLISALSGVDIVVSGHTHQHYFRTRKDKDGKSVYFGQCGEYGGSIAKRSFKISLDLDNSNHDRSTTLSARPRRSSSYFSRLYSYLFSGEGSVRQSRANIMAEHSTRVDMSPELPLSDDFKELISLWEREISDILHSEGSSYKFNDLVYSAKDDSQEGPFQSSWSKLDITRNHANNMLVAVNELQPCTPESLGKFTFLESALKNFPTTVPARHKHAASSHTNGVATDLASEESSKTGPKLATWRKVDVYVAVEETIREDFHARDGRISLQYSDLWRQHSIMGPWPVSVFCLTKSHLLLLVEVIDFVDRFIRDAPMVFSANVTYDTGFGVPLVGQVPLLSSFSRIRNVRLDGKPYEEWPDYVCLAMSGYFTRYIYQIPDYTFGLISLTPRDSHGAPIAIRDTMRDVTVVECAANYLSSLFGPGQST